jgi:serine/threonine-protein kinase
MGIVHRDLKPENIYLCNQGGLIDYPKVLDFGLAKVTEQQMRPGSLILTQEGMVFGTPEFMSPEQAQGKPLDARSDIYSLAVILFEMLTGKLPFVTQTPMEYIQKHVLEKPRTLAESAPERGYSQQLEFVVAKALAKRPEDRWQSAIEFARSLEEALAPPASRPSSMLDARMLGVTPTSVVASKWAALSVSPVVLLLVVSVACMLLGVILAVAILQWVVR